MKLSECLEIYIRYHKLQFHTEQTIENYKLFIHLFIEFCGDIELCSLNREKILKFNEALIDRHLKKASVATYLRHIKAFVRFCEDSGFEIEKGLYHCVKIPRKSKKEIYMFSSSDIAIILQSITANPEWIEKRNKAIFALMYDSGLRVAEVCAAMKNDISFKYHRMLVHGKGDKERVVPLGTITEKYLMEYLDACPYSSEALFLSHSTKPITTDGVKSFMNKLKHQTGYKGLSSHKLRHNFATNYCLDGYIREGYVDTYKLRSLMGHEKIETTDLYLHMAQDIIANNNFRSHLDSMMKNQGV